MTRSSGHWFGAFRPLCNEVCLEANAPYGVDVVLFYVARWCQKASGEAEPDVDSLDVREAAAKIARNLTEDGPLVDRLVAGDAAAWTELRGLLRASAGRRVGGQAIEFADEAEQKIALILLTGTPPSQAAERLRQGPDGPRNEYVFQSPFSYWARAVLIHMIIDEQRRAAREREPPPPASLKDTPHLDGALLEQARLALPGLVAAIRELPPVQHSVMVHSLSRRDLDDAIRSRLRKLAPDMFSLADDELPGSDTDIAERLGSERHAVAASRSAARRKLARRNPAWALLLDVMLPHKTTKPLVPTSPEAANA